MGKPSLCCSGLIKREDVCNYMNNNRSFASVHSHQGPEVQIHLAVANFIS